MADSTYQKSGLQSNQIRILILLPIDQDLDDAFIQCRLVSTSIENPVLYEALSYTWGDDALAPTRYIDCDGEVVPVTVNLYEALMALRYNESPWTLWVDALCINQSNSQERNHQVALMALIYRRAIGVLIWVGMEGPARDGERSFRYLKELYDVVCKNSKNVRQDGSAVADERYTWGQAPPAHPSVEFVLDLFLSRSWFRRRWILQEVCTSYFVCDPVVSQLTPSRQRSGSKDLLRSALHEVGRIRRWFPPLILRSEPQIPTPAASLQRAPCGQKLDPRSSGSVC